jgi:hypothetical protein
MKDNVSRSFERRHVIPDTRFSSGQCPRCDVNVPVGARDLHAVREIYKFTGNKQAVRHTYQNGHLPDIICPAQCPLILRGLSIRHSTLGQNQPNRHYNIKCRSPHTGQFTLARHPHRIQILNLILFRQLWRTPIRPSHPILLETHLHNLGI